jgi:hypothetical protein
MVGHTPPPVSPVFRSNVFPCKFARFQICRLQLHCSVFACSCGRLLRYATYERLTYGKIRSASDVVQRWWLGAHGSHDTNHDYFESRFCGLQRPSPRNISTAVWQLSLHRKRYPGNGTCTEAISASCPSTFCCL